MGAALSKVEQEYREKARHVAEKYMRPRSAQCDRTGEYPRDVMQQIIQAGLMGVWIPKEYGGGGFGVMETCLIVEELSRVCGGLGVAFSVNALGSFPIVLGGSEAQKKKYLPRIASGADFISFALSEKSAGSDAGGMKTVAVRNGEDYVIDGDKKWTTNAGVANLFTVFASTDPSKGTRGITAFEVERNHPGFTIGLREDTMGIRCVPIHETHYKQCRVPAADRLGEEGKGFHLAMATLDRARPSVAAQAVGVAQGALDLAAQFVSQRKQFGQKIGQFQAIQFMLADMGTQVEAARQLVYASARAVDGLEPGYSKLAAMAKVFASDTAMKVTTDAVQLFGGYGYVRDYPIEKYMRDAKITQIYEGTNQVQRIVISREILKEAEAALADPAKVLVRPPE